MIKPWDYLSHFFYSESMSPIQVILKKIGITVIRNDKNELVPTQVQSQWRVFFDYRKLRVVTREYYFCLPCFNQMLEKLAGHFFNWFFYGYSVYIHISIALEDQKNTIFTCPFDTYAFRRVSIGLCNALTIFQRCMIFIFSYLFEYCMKIFIDDFSIFGSCFDGCLSILSKVLKRCKEKNLTLN